MNRFRKLFSIIRGLHILTLVTIFCAIFAFFSIPSVQAAVGIRPTINFQGKLVDPNELNVADSDYDITFNLYTVSAAGTPIWTESHTGVNDVTVEDGIFRVELGTISSLAGVDFNQDELWLGITVEADSEMTPRIRFTAVPYAFQAKNVAWSGLQNPAANTTLSMSTYTSSFNWATGTSTNNLFSLTTDASANGTGSLLNLQTGAGSTVSPLRVRAGTTESLMVDSSGNVGIGNTAPSQKLHVTGNLRVTGGFYDSTNSAGSAGMVLTSTGTGTSWNTISATIGTTAFIQNGNSFGVLATLGTNDSFALAFETAGTERMRLSTSGNLGIGTTGTVGSRLAVSGGIGVGSTSPSSTYLSSIAPDGGMIIEGNVGIGTTSPNSALDVAGQVRIRNTGNALILTGDSSNIFFNSGTGVKQIVTGGTTNLALMSGGNVGVGTTVPGSKLTVSGGVGIGSTSPTSTYLSSIAPHGGLIVEGNVGIGTTSPTSTLTVNGTVRANGLVAHNGSGQNIAIYDGTDFRFGPTGAVGSNLIFSLNGEKFRVTSAGNFGIGVTAPSSKLAVGGGIGIGTSSPTSVYTRTAIAPDGGLIVEGNVGIGTTNPGTKLDVAGFIYASGLSTYNTSTSIGTIEAAKFCTGDGETNCVTSFSSLSPWTDAGTYLYPTANEALGNSASAGANKLTGIYLGDTSPLYFGLTNDANLSYTPSNTRLNITAADNSGQGRHIGITAGSSSGGDGGSVYINAGSGNTNDGNILMSQFYGSVGIGTTLPTQKLHVQGNLRVTGALYDSINSAGSVGMVLTSTGTGTSWNTLAGAIATTAFIQNGNSFGALATLGTNDSNSLAFETAGVERLRINTSGNVGIGTTGTPGSRLVVSGGVGIGTTAPSSLYLSATAPHGGLIVEGNVGVGTTNPATKLEVFASSNQLRLTSPLGSTTFSDLGGDLSIIPSGSDVSVIGNITASQGQLVASSPDTLKWLELGDDGTVGYIGTDYGGPPGEHALAFRITNTERMRLDTDGDLGIGTTDPTQKLHVQGNLRLTGALYDSTNSAGSAGMVLTSTGTGTSWNTLSGAIATTAFIQNGNSFGALATLGTNDGNALAFETGGTERMRIDTSGNVGIGTTNPTSTLTLRNADPKIGFIDTTGGSSEYQIRNGTYANGTFDIFDNTAGVSRFLINASGHIGMGSTPISEARLFVFGNTSTGANVDIRSATTALPATIEVQADDFDTSFQSAYLQYNGSAAVGNIIGAIPRADAAILTFQESVNSLIYTTGSSPLIFGTNSLERMRMTAAGNIGIGTSVPGSRLAVSGGVGIGTTAPGSTYLSSIAPHGGLIVEGNVGIGTTSPTQALHVSGNLRLTGGLYDSANSVGTAGYILSSTGTGTTWIPSTGGSIDGTGLANYVARWSDTDTLTTGVLYDNGTNVGIGTTNPQSALHLGTGSQIRLPNGTAANPAIMFNADTDNGIYLDGSDRLTIGKGGGDLVYFNDGGDAIETTVGRGIKSGGDLYVVGNTILGDGTSRTISFGGRVNSNIVPSTDGSYSLGSASLRWNELFVKGASIHIGDSGNESVIGYNTTGNFFNINSNGTGAPELVLTSNGSLGIGTTGPNAKLQLDVATASSKGVVIRSTDNSDTNGLFEFQNSAGTTVARLNPFADPATSTNFLYNTNSSYGQNGSWNVFDVQNGGSSIFRVSTAGAYTTGLFTASAGIQSVWNNGSPTARFGNTAGDIIQVQDHSGSNLWVIEGGTGDIVSAVANGATAVGNAFDTTNNLTTAGAKLLSFKNAGIEKAYIDKDGGAFFGANVGIGTSVPNERLDIRGAIYIGDTSAPAVTTNRLYSVSGDLYWDGTQLDGVGGGSSSPWIDGGTYVYLNGNETVGNSASAGSNKISGLYLGDTSPLYFGADNDINFSFNNALSTLQIAMGNNDLNFDSDTLFIDGSASTVGIGTTVATSKLNVGGDILLAGTGADTLSSNANELVLQQTGDTYGTTRLRLQHRDGANGAIFENAGSHELVDFGFRTPSAVTRNIRLENRGSAVAGSPTFHIGGANPDAPSLGVGDSYVAVAGSLVIGGYTQPGNNLSVLGTGYVSGNFGLGTASPDFALQVNGVVAPETTDQDMGTSSLRWDIFGNTINADSTVTLTGLGTGVDNTVLVLDSSNNVTTDEIDARVWGTTLLDSSTGAANYLARFTDGDTLGIGTVYDTGTNVGIGTTNPAETLDVQGNVRLTTSQFRIANETAFSAEGSIVEGDWEQYVLAGTGVNRTLRMGVTNDGYTKSEIEFENNNSVNGTIALKTSDGSVGSAIRLFVNGLGNIGIGTTAPNERLDLRGAIYIGDTSAPGVTTNRLYATSGNLFWNGTQLNAGGASPFTDGGTYLYPTANETLGNSASAGANKLTGIYLGDSSPLSFGLDNDIGFNYNNATSMLNVTQGSADVNFDANTLFVDGSANAVGIGTTTPGAQLDVAGRVKLGSNITYANNTTQVIIGSNNGSDPQCGLWSCGLAYNEQLNSLAASGGYYGTLGSVTNNTAGSNFVVGAHYAANTLVNSGAVEGVAASANVGAGVTVSSNIRGLFTSVGSSHSSGVATIAEATSIWSFDNFADNTNITNLYGIKSQLSGLGTGSIISNLYGHYIDADSSDGTVTKSFGLYITNVRDPAFAAANDFGIYQEGSNDYNYFAGNLGIGTSAPTQAFQVVGNSIISGYTKINNVAIGGSAPGITGCNDFSDMICGGSNLWLGASSGGGQVYFEDDLNINGQDITAAGSFSGAGLTDCDTTNSKLLWDSTSGDFSCGTDRASATIVKPTVEAVTSSTIPQADDHLTFSVGANETWVVQYNLRVSSPNLGGIAVGVSAPSGANCKFVAGELENNVANAQNGCAVTAATAMNLGTGVLTTDPAIVYGMVTTGATSGNVELWWAQATANATPSRVHEGSFLIAFKSSGADLAESYNTRDKSIKPGDVVSVDPTLKNGVKKSTGAYDEKVLGIVPTQPGIVLSDGSPPVGTKSVLLALAGRVPVKVNLENGPIKAGDYLTTSSIPGEAMKATKSGIAIGKALEDYNGSSSTIFEEGKVMTFVELGYYSPDIKLNADGNLDVVVENDKYVAKYTDGSTIEQKGGFAEAVIASLTSGKIDVKELFLGDIDVRAKLEELIAAQDGNQIQLQSLLSQLNEQENLTASQAAQLAANTQQLSAMQNASGSGEMQASSSGLIAQLSDRVSFLEQMLYGQDVGAVLGVQSGGIASESGSLSELLVDKPIRFSEDTIFDEDLTVLGDARFNDISLTGAISNGLLTINGFDDSTATPSATISTLNGSLKLQHLGLGEVDIMAGKVRIDTQGNMIIAEGVLKGNDEFRGTIKLPRNAKSVRVDRNWTEAPATVIASPDFETYVWISELDEDGFTINVKDSSTQAQDLFWAAIF